MGNGSNQHRRLTTDEERFWSGVDRRGPDECWPWLRSTNRHGYGKVWIDGKVVLAHRQAVIYDGRAPGTASRHSCDNPPCCNPAHVIGGDQLANVADCVAKGRTPAGERNANANLTERDVLAIRARVASGELQRAVAREYGLAQGRISEIVNYKSWRNI